MITGTQKIMVQTLKNMNPSTPLKYIVMTLFTLFFASTGRAFPALEGILINAEDMFQDSERGVIELAKGVQIIFKNQHLSAEQAIIHPQGKTVEARGNVTISSTQVTISARRVVINYETNLGVIYDGYVKSGSVVFAGEIIHKVGQDDYEVEKGDYTACDTCPAAWNFTGHRIKAHIGGYAHITYPILRVAGLPILPLPYIIVPLKSQRQSGLLFPSFGFSNEGLSYSQSFFWAMARNQDSTWTLENHPRRRRFLLEYRYLLSHRSGGALNYTFVDAHHLGKNDGRFNEYRDKTEQFTELKRWYLKYQQHSEFAKRYTYRMNLELPSDLQYPKDFPEETKTNGYPALDNRISLTKNTNSQHFSIDSSYYINLLQANPFADNKVAVHRLPEIHYSLTEQRILQSSVLFNLDVNYTNFYRKSLGYDDITELDEDGQPTGLINDGPTYRFPSDEADGSFDSQDMIRTGERLRFQPSLSYPLHIGPYFDLIPRLNFNQTRYRFHIGENSDYQRSYLRTSLSAKTTISRVYNQNTNKLPSYKHEIQPEIRATAIPWLEDDGHPFFNIRGEQAETPFFRFNESINDQDLFSDRRLQFDYFDRLYDRELVTFALNNKFTRKTWGPNGPIYRQIAQLRISQTYDAFEARRNTEQPWSTVDTLLSVRLKNFETATRLSYYPYHAVANFDSRLRFILNSRDYFEFLINRKFQIGDELKVPYEDRTEDYTLSFSKSWKYLDLGANIVYNQVKEELKSWKTSALLKFPGNCWRAHVSLSDSRDQLDPPELNVSFQFKFDGNQSLSL